MQPGGLRAKSVVIKAQNCSSPTGSFYVLRINFLKYNDQKVITKRSWYIYTAYDNLSNIAQASQSDLSVLKPRCSDAV